MIVTRFTYVRINSRVVNTESISTVLFKRTMIYVFRALLLDTGIIRVGNADQFIAHERFECHRIRNVNRLNISLMIPI